MPNISHLLSQFVGYRFILAVYGGADYEWCLIGSQLKLSWVGISISHYPASLITVITLIVRVGMHKSKIFIFEGCMISGNSCRLFSDGCIRREMLLGRLVRHRGRFVKCLLVVFGLVQVTAAADWKLLATNWRYHKKLCSFFLHQAANWL